MNSFRCHKCRQLQYKYRLRGNKLEIETKCYNCNTYDVFVIWLNKLNKDIINQNVNEKDNQQK